MKCHKNTERNAAKIPNYLRNTKIIRIFAIRAKIVILLACLKD